MNAAHAAGRAHHHGRTFVVRLVALRAHGSRLAVLRPGSLELRAIALRVVALEPDPILVDATGDHHFTGFLEDRPPLLVIRIQQPLTAPALQPRGQLPPEVRRVLEAGIQTETSVR